METKNNFTEIYKGKADLAKFGFSEWQISNINAFCEILQLLYKEGVDPEEDLTTKLVVLKMQCLIADKIRKNKEEDPQGTKELSELAFNIATGT